MPNSIGPTGLTTQTQAELIAQYTAAFQSIYGADIDLTPSSPDGQMMMIWIQQVLDQLDLITQVYTSFDPDQAFGTTLDQRLTINGIERQAGTFTLTNITVVVNQALTLTGLDDSPDNPYTVADGEGTHWQLVATENIAVAGAYVLVFQAADPGAVLTTPNTITVPVSIVLGVVSINNPTTYTTLGLNEETDAQVKIRRQKSVALGSQGYLAGLLAALENITGVTAAFVYENNTGSTDVNNVPGHSIWVIVAGTAADADIAAAIYTKRNAGCGMFGAESFTITQVDGSPFTVHWDVVDPQDLFVAFCASSLNGSDLPNSSSILSGLLLSTNFAGDCGVAAQVNINDFATRVQETDPNALVTDAGFATVEGGPYVATLRPTSKNNQFALEASNILLIYALTLQATASGGQIQFHVAGGTAAYTYAMVSGAGAINAATGLYTAAGAGTDVVHVTDSNGNVAKATITVS